MRWVSSRFFTAVPRLLAASRSSAANRSCMLFSGRYRANATSQRMDREVRRSGRTSTGTWYVEPPTRRDFTSRAGLTLSTACLNSLSGSCFARSAMRSSAWYMIPSERLRLPPRIITLMNLATSRLPYFGSGLTSRRWTMALRGMVDSLRRAALGRLGTVLGPALPAVRDAGGVEDPADDVVPHARQVLHAPAPDQDNRVLLEVVAHPGDVRRHLDGVRQPHPCDLAERRVRLLRRRR